MFSVFLKIPCRSRSKCPQQESITMDLGVRSACQEEIWVHTSFNHLCEGLECMAREWCHSTSPLSLVTRKTSLFVYIFNRKWHSKSPNPLQHGDKHASIYKMSRHIWLFASLIFQNLSSPPNRIELDQFNLEKLIPFEERSMRTRKSRAPIPHWLCFIINRVSWRANTARFILKWPTQNKAAFY